MCVCVCVDLQCDSEHHGDGCKRQRSAVRFLTASEPHCHRRAGWCLRRTGQGRKRQTHTNKDREAVHLMFSLIHSDGLHCIKYSVWSVQRVCVSMLIHSLLRLLLIHLFEFFCVFNVNYNLSVIYLALSIILDCASAILHALPLYRASQFLITLLLFFNFSSGVDWHVLKLHNHTIHLVDRHVLLWIQFLWWHEVTTSKETLKYLNNRCL